MNNKLQLTSHERPRFAKATQGERVTGHGSRKNAASALILAVILTSLLAIIGVMFVMIARVDKMATSAISENKELNFAVETVVAKISQELVLDVPRTDSNGLKLSEYYDYPGEEDKWLANLEPYDDGGTYKWRQISDVTGFLNDKGFSTQNVNVEPVGLITTVYVHDYPVIRVDPNGRFLDDKTGNIATDGVSADADGDGIADSKWIKLDNITSNKGKPIYAAIRIVDNGGMINVNTAYKFNPNETDSNLIDGSSQLQINLEALARGSGTDTIDEIDDARNPLSRPLSDYQDEVIWKIEDPCSDYLPFDISDELELRNRFFLTSLAKTRLEATWNSTIGSETFKRVPYDSDMVGWFAKFDPDSNEPDRRHLLTTCNMDRIIDPNGAKMTNINTADVNALYNSIRKGLLDTNYPDVNVAAQITANLIDYVDGPGYPTSDPRYDPCDNVTVVYDDANIPYYGFERPCIYISELAHRFKKDMADPNIVYKSYAVELYKPYSTDDDPDGWQLVIDGNPPIPIDWSRGSQRFYVMRFEDPTTPPSLNPPLLPVPFDEDPIDPNYARTPVEPGYSFHFNAGSVISLQRPVDDVNGVGVYVAVDSKVVPDPNATTGWLEDSSADDDLGRSFPRLIELHRCIWRRWSPGALYGESLSRSNLYVVFSQTYIQAHPEDKAFANIGEIGKVFVRSAYSEGSNPISRDDDEATIRLNLADSAFQQIFNYLTVFDPCDHITDPNKLIGNETKIKGRININTAPWYVLAQLPWVTDPALAADDPNRYNLAREIVKHRDAPLVEGFKSIGELMNVTGMDYYKTQSGDLTGFPDLTTLPTGGDGAPDDFEERDVIFARISNLVTVRSDVFTAYILVRIGTDGPQKRVMAILDRSNVYSGDGKVRIVALHLVPDPR